MIQRTLAKKLYSLSQQFQAITLTGPRQSGKTTLVKEIFPDLPYVSLEDPDMRQFALNDPRGFFANFPKGAVLDEVQNVPDLLSYIQRIIDENRGIKFILTGSSNLLLMEKVGQTLAGRTAILHLLPFSLQELSPNSEEDYESWLYKGFYPRIYDRNLSPNDFYPSYIQTYVERDVRQIRNLGDLNPFILFLKLCAGRVGQMINLAGLAADADISPNTAKAWLSVLENSFVIYRLQPYYRNFNKRLTKSSKLYFHDTGVACSLLGIQDVGQVRLHYLKGALFENLVLNEFIKNYFNSGDSRQPYFWQDNHGKEIDCLLENSNRLIPVEIKSGRTYTSNFFDNLVAFQTIAGIPKADSYVVYGGDQSMQTSAGNLLSWRNLDRIEQ